MLFPWALAACALVGGGQLFSLREKLDLKLPKKIERATLKGDDLQIQLKQLEEVLEHNKELSFANAVLRERMCSQRAMRSATQAGLKKQMRELRQQIQEEHASEVQRAREEGIAQAAAATEKLERKLEEMSREYKASLIEAQDDAQREASAQIKELKAKVQEETAAARKEAREEAMREGKDELEALKAALERKFMAEKQELREQLDATVDQESKNILKKMIAREKKLKEKFEKQIKAKTKQLHEMERQNMALREQLGSSTAASQGGGKRSRTAKSSTSSHAVNPKATRVGAGAGTGRKVNH
ncbi:unnamed protein product [Chrysoparadoxa australica]